MIYEMRTYTTPPGKAQVLADTSAALAREIRGDDYGKLEGYWITEIGALNRCMHLWSYNDLNHREERRTALAQNTRWKTEYLPKILPIVLRQDIRLMAPVRPLKAPAATGNIYEFRQYRCKTGKAAAFAGLLRDAMAVRERYSDNVCIWQTMAGQPNEVCHLWAYESLDKRAEVRRAAVADPEWRAFLAEAHHHIEEMETVVMLPWKQSPLK